MLINPREAVYSGIQILPVELLRLALALAVVLLEVNNSRIMLNLLLLDWEVVSLEVEVLSLAIIKISRIRNNSSLNKLVLVFSAVVQAHSGLVRLVVVAFSVTLDRIRTSSNNSLNSNLRVYSALLLLN
jgi:hypothetical protein